MPLVLNLQYHRSVVSRHVSIQRLLVVAFLGGAGCTGYIEAGGGIADLPPDQAAAQAQWGKYVLPILKTGTTPACIDCHGGGTPPDGLTAGPAWLAGGDDNAIRQTLLGFQPAIINMNGDAMLSLLVVKQGHEGPAMDVIQTSTIVDWIRAEQKAKMTGN